MEKCIYNRLMGAKHLSQSQFDVYFYEINYNLESSDEYRELSKSSYINVLFLADHQHHHGAQKDLNPEDLRREK